MKKYRMELLDQILEGGGYFANLETGEIHSKTNNEIIGHSDKKTGIKIVNLTHPSLFYEGTTRKKVFSFSVSNIIAYLGGLFKDIEEPQRYIVMNIDEDKKNTSINNLKIVKRADYNKQLYKEGKFHKFSKEDLKKGALKRRGFSSEQIKEFRDMHYKEGYTIKAISVKFEVPYMTMNDIINFKLYNMDGEDQEYDRSTRPSFNLKKEEVNDIRDKFFIKKVTIKELAKEYRKNTITIYRIVKFLSHTKGFDIDKYNEYR